MLYSGYNYFMEQNFCELLKIWIFELLQICGIPVCHTRHLFGSEVVICPMLGAQHRVLLPYLTIYYLFHHCDGRNRCCHQ